jgi:hypothetical protein
MPDGEAKRLRTLAAEALAIAEQMTDPDCRRQMFDVAACYERLADHVDARKARETREPPTEKKQ